jgi:hypothetical protein
MPDNPVESLPQVAQKPATRRDFLLRTSAIGAIAIAGEYYLGNAGYLALKVYRRWARRSMRRQPSIS